VSIDPNNRSVRGRPLVPTVGSLFPRGSDGNRKLPRPQRMPELPTPLILLVENDLALRLRGANELLDEGYEVVESESAVEAAKILEGRGDFDVMVADVSSGVPGILALLRFARIHRPDMAIMVDTRWAIDPAIAFTADDDVAGTGDGVLVQMMRRLLTNDASAQPSNAAKVFPAESVVR
jgi:CheY-like chemotaxis protein